MRSDAFTIPRTLSITLAALPATVAAAIPMWAATTISSDIISILGLGGIRATTTWILSLTVALSVVGLKFLLPWHAHERPPAWLSWVAWAVTIMLSSLAVAPTGLRFLPSDASLILRGACAAAWLCIEVVGTLIFPALASGSVAAPITAQRPVHVDVEPRLSAGSAPSSPSADMLFDWLRSLLELPQEKIPDGIYIDDRRRFIAASQRRLAYAWRQPRTNVVRRLKRLERQGRIKIETNEEGTAIHILQPASVGDGS